MEPFAALLFVALAIYMMVNLPERREQELAKACRMCQADPDKGDKHPLTVPGVTARSLLYSVHGASAAMD